jgi:uncharacterized protein with HEPN domain
MVERQSDRDMALLLDMLLAARDARAFVAGLDEAAFVASRLHQRDIIGMRHRLIHGYAEVRLDLVWQVVDERLGPLIAMLEPLVPDERQP